MISYFYFSCCSIWIWPSFMLYLFTL